eukprot:2522146-Pleurochrysis_carterae.AAC.3
MAKKVKEHSQRAEQERRARYKLELELKEVKAQKQALELEVNQLRKESKIESGALKAARAEAEKLQAKVVTKENAKYVAAASSAAEAKKQVTLANKNVKNAKDAASKLEKDLLQEGDRAEGLEGGAAQQVPGGAAVGQGHGRRELSDRCFHSGQPG